MPDSNLEVARFLEAEGELVCCLEMAGPESRSSSAALPSRGSTEWRKLCLDFSFSQAGSCS